MTLRKLSSLGFLLLACALPLAACSSDDDDSSNNNGGGGQSTTTTTTRISADKGGQVTDSAGTVTLDIPAGALSEDTDITLAVSAATSATVSSVYDFGPDGLTFLKPATLTIKVDASAVGDKEVAVAIEEGGKFVPLSGSSYADGVATAPVEHFSKFAVIFVDGQTENNACDDLVTNFDACGGEIVGTWVFEGFCAGKIQGGGPVKNCPQQEVTVDIEQVGLEYTFGEDKSFSATAGTEIEKMTVDAPLSCFGGAPNCAAVAANSSEENVTCSDKSDTECSCTRTRSKAREAQSGTYEVNEGVVEITTGDGTDTTEYCVQGDTLLVLLHEDEASFVVTFKRK